MLQTDRALRQYFDVETLKNASGYIFANITAAPGNAPAASIFCNGFFLREGNDVYIGTAAHCVKGTTAQKHFFFPEGHADTAIQYVHPSRYAEHRISDPNNLPDLRKSTTPESASGRVVASYSWATDNPDPRKVLPQDMKRKLHFSFAMPLPPIARQHVGGQNVDVDYPAFKEGMMFLKPPSEGMAAKTQKGGKKVVEASGTSGSAVGAFINGKYTIVGNLVGMRELGDKCLKVCYPIATSSAPYSLHQAIDAERRSRLAKSRR